MISIETAMNHFFFGGGGKLFYVFGFTPFTMYGNVQLLGVMHRCEVLHSSLVPGAFSTGNIAAPS